MTTDTLSPLCDAEYQRGLLVGTLAERARHAALVAAAREVDLKDAALLTANEEGDDDDIWEADAEFVDAMATLRAALKNEEQHD